MTGTQTSSKKRLQIWSYYWKYYHYYNIIIRYGCGYFKGYKYCKYFCHCFCKSAFCFPKTITNFILYFGPKRMETFLDHIHLWLLLCIIQFYPVFVSCTVNFAYRQWKCSWDRGVVSMTESCLFVIQSPKFQPLVSLNLLMQLCTVVDDTFTVSVALHRFTSK